MKKRIAFINVVCNGSTGKIMCDIATKAEIEGFETCCFFGRGNSNENLNCVKIGNKLSILFHVFLARIGFNGHGSYFATKKLIKSLKKFNPDIIHMHNIHGYYLNLKLLFKYLKNEYKGKVVWMLHDCWAFTGHCSHYTYKKCMKWKNECYNCPQLKNYPKEFFDTTKYEYNLKKNLFTSLDEMLIVTPSYWLEKQVKNSFLKKFNIKTIYNGIDLNIFKPIIDSTIYKKYSIPENKKIILGVSNVWEEKKGLKTFFEISKLLKSNEIIVLVGLRNKQLKNLPSNIVGISRTDNQADLAKIYSIADVFINPSFEETFSLVTVEAMACGTPVVVCGMTAPKELVNEDVGIVLDKYTANDYYNAYQKIKSENLDKETIIKYASKYSNKIMADENIKLYRE